MKSALTFVIFLFVLIGCGFSSEANISADTIVDESQLPSDTLIQVSYWINKDRNAYAQDYLHDNAKYLAYRDAYDVDNNHIEHIRYSPAGFIEEHIVYVYKNGLIAEEYRLENSAEEVLFKTKWIYDKKNTLTSKVSFTFRKKSLERPHYDFEAKYEDTKSWALLTTEVFLYNEKGQLREQEETWAHGSTESEVYEYDSLGRVIAQDSWRNGSVTRKITTSYFTDSLQTYCVLYTIANNPGSTSTKIFDKRNNLLDEKQVDKSTGLSSFRRLYTYDSNNQLIKQEYITNTGASIFTDYAYAEYDTPVKRTFTVNNK